MYCIILILCFSSILYYNVFRVAMCLACSIPYLLCTLYYPPYIHIVYFILLLHVIYIYYTTPYIGASVLSDRALAEFADVRPEQYKDDSDDDSVAAKPKKVRLLVTSIVLNL